MLLLFILLDATVDVCVVVSECLYFPSIRARTHRRDGDSVSRSVAARSRRYSHSEW